MPRKELPGGYSTTGASPSNEQIINDNFKRLECEVEQNIISAGALSLNLRDSRERIFDIAAAVGADFTLSILNEPQSVDFALRLTTSTTVNITMPANVKSSASGWTSGSHILNLAAGENLISFVKIGSFFFMSAVTGLA